MLTLAFNIQPVEAEPRTWTVDDDGAADFQTIQEAINVANEGDTIFVRSGIYYEHVVLNKTVSLLGVEGSIIDASQEIVDMINPSIAKWNGITILANYCTVTGFEIRNAANFGIEIRADYGVFQENLVEDCNWAGISVFAGVHDSVPYYSSHDNLIHNNTVSLNHMGIWLSDAYNNKVSFNIVEWNRWNGIYLSSGAKNNTIISNSVSNSIGTQFNEGGYGIAVGTGSHNNVIAGNDISNNSADGIRIEIFGLGFPLPHANTVFHNNFVGNTIQAFDDGINNTWDGGYPSGGNYWSDYEKRYPAAEELDGSGIWDTPYDIDENNQDNYPLMEPWSPEPPNPVEATQELIETIETWNLHKGTENSLKAKLKAAIHMLDMGREDGAIHKLSAFINRVEMLREKTLATEQADYLIAEAQRIINLING